MGEYEAGYDEEYADAGAAGEDEADDGELEDVGIGW